VNARRLPVVSGKAAVKALRRAGYALRHIRGSHHIMTHPGPPARMVAVPVHGNRSLPPGTLSAILEEAHLTVDEFAALL
jgi:predicted RNA binding protein YcfA (HicA-like mRNA interferase family)